MSAGREHAMQLVEQRLRIENESQHGHHGRHIDRGVVEGQSEVDIGNCEADVIQTSQRGASRRGPNPNVRDVDSNEMPKPRCASTDERPVTRPNVEQAATFLHQGSDGVAAVQLEPRYQAIDQAGSTNSLRTVEPVIEAALNVSWHAPQRVTSRS